MLTRKKKTTIRKTKKIFERNDYENKNGMLTFIWGPSLWHYLHTMSFNYPIEPTKQDKKHYRDFILNLENVLPCGKCRKNLRKNFKKLPLTMEWMKTRETFSRYIYELHEVVNALLKKKSFLTYEDVRERYEHFRARCLEKELDIKKKHDLGCTEPVYGEKSKCILRIVPEKTKCETLEIDNRCIKKKVV
jgi:hypothetical protein